MEVPLAFGTTARPHARVKLKAVAELLGVGRQTVSDWFTSNTGDGKGSKPDARVKLKAVAELLGVSRQSVTACPEGCGKFPHPLVVTANFVSLPPIGTTLHHTFQHGCMMARSVAKHITGQVSQFR